MKSCIYKGPVRHRRFAPGQHEFSYGLFMMYLDLQELPDLFKPFWLWSTERFNLASYRRKDHLGDPQNSLLEEVKDRIQEHTGRRPEGPIRLLTHLRYLGYGFNPVSFYYCFDAEDKKLETIVCEVNNTPWGEQHLYVLSDYDSAPLTANQSTGRKNLKFQRKKEFHVSPFMPMDIDYDWTFSVPGEKLNIHMQNYQQGEKLFDATLTFKKLPINSATLASVLTHFPLMTLKVVGGIYFEALRLWLKKIPFYSYAENSEAPKSVNKQ